MHSPRNVFANVTESESAASEAEAEEGPHEICATRQRALLAVRSDFKFLETPRRSATAITRSARFTTVRPKLAVLS